MAWWNRPGAGLTPPVTLERVAAWFDARDFAYDLDAEGGRIDSGFGGHTFVVDLVNEGLVTVHGRCWINLPGDEDTATALRALLGEMNRNQFLPTLSSFMDEDGRQVGAQVPVTTASGLNDDQLNDILDTCLRAIMSSFEEICDTLGVDPAPEAQAEAGQAGAAERGGIALAGPEEADESGPGSASSAVSPGTPASPASAVSPAGPGTPGSPVTPTSPATPGSAGTSGSASSAAGAVSATSPAGPDTPASAATPGASHDEDHDDDDD